MASNAVCIYSSPYEGGPRDFETRKSQKLGYSSLGGPLPKDRPASNGIRPGPLLGPPTEDAGSPPVGAGPRGETPDAAKGNIEEVGRMELEVDRLYWLVVRQLLLAAQNRTISGRIGVTEPRHLLGDRVVTVALENVGDLWEEAAAGVGPFLKPNRRIPREFAKTVGNLKGKLEEVIELTMTAFFANDLGKANTALDHQAALIRDIRAAAESGPRSRSPQARSPPRSNGLFQIVLRPLEHVAKYYGSIAQITINRALERPVRPRPAGAEPPPPPEPTDRP